MLPEDIPSTFCVAGRPAVNFRQLSLRQGNLLSTSINYPYGWENFCGLPLTSVLVVVLLSTSIYFPYRQETFHQLPSTFRMAWSLVVDFHQHSVHSRNLISTIVNFLCGMENFHQHMSTFRAVRRPSVC